MEVEFGRLISVEDDVKINSEDSSYTHPDEVEEFVICTGVDSLTSAIGTIPGTFKFWPIQKPKLRFDIIDKVSKRLSGFSIVLYGVSSVFQKYVKIIQRNGKQLKDAIGISKDMLWRVEQK